MPDMGGLLCVNGLQHHFVMTSWAMMGSTSYFAIELMCPTCGTVVHRDEVREPWHGISGSDEPAP